ncbi:polyketide cyclase [Halpernia sp.]|uniref:polyketide cyclase n=1 Tax=Halpernia sp. TaxID=2782209 RepID=UPI003A8CD8E9
MRWFKFAVFFGIFAFAAYYFSASYMEDSKTFSSKKELNYSVEKLFPQFNNLQNFTKWNTFFKGHKNYHYSFFTPYEGKNSGLTYYNEKNEREGDLFIKFSEENRAIRYYLYTETNVNPFILEVKFKKIATDKTVITYLLKTPKIPIMSRPFHVVSEDDFTDNLNNSLVNLSNLLSNKVDKEIQMSRLKFDSIMVENEGNSILLGVNVSSSNKKDALLKNIILNHNKVKNFLQTDLQKEEDEFGTPVLITDPNSLKDKEVSYYYGFPLSKKINVTDNNFIYRYLTPKKYLIIYYKGNYLGRINSLKKLFAEAKKEELKTGQLYETFLEPPSESGEVTLKLALEIL